MMQALQSWNRRDALAVLFLVAWQALYFFPVTLAQAVWFGSDMFRAYYPFGVEFARALHDGRLPLWTTGMGAGFPLLAESQVGALYPVNLILFAILPPHFAPSYSILLHLAWAACGIFAWLKSQGFRTSSGVFAGLVFSFSGFMLSRLTHFPLLITSSWLPWLVLFQEQFQRAGAQRKTTAGFWFGLVAIGSGVQWLCGFPQIAFMNTLAVALIGFFVRLVGNVADEKSQMVNWHIIFKNVPQSVLWSILPIVLGTGVAAIQLLPTAELAGFSVRGGSPSYGFATSYSLPPDSLFQFVSPFIRGEPSDGVNNEYWAYLGLVPLVMAILAPFLRRDKRTIFFVFFALGALSLAFGEHNPVYNLLYQLPGFGWFRVPARYLLLFVFVGAFLGATGFDELSNRLAPRYIRKKQLVACTLFLASATTVAIWCALTQELEFWLQVWQFLPRALISIGLGILVFAWVWQFNRALFQTIVLGFTLFDLACAAPLFVITLGRPEAPASATSIPDSVSVIDIQQGNGRVYAEYYDASESARRASLYSNTALLYGKENAQAYTPLAFARHTTYLADLSPAMFNLLNVRYFTVPLEPRLENQMVMPFGTLVPNVLNTEQVISPQKASAIEVSSFTERAENLANGTPVGQVMLRQRDGRVLNFPLRVGIETADWDYARKNPRHSRATVAHTFPAAWSPFDRAFDGNAYSASFSFEPSEIVGVNVQVLDPTVHLTIERITLYNMDNQPASLAKLVGKNDFVLVYLSDTVAVWENLDALPRAFVAHTATIVNDDAAFARLRAPGFQPEREVLLSEGVELRDGKSARDSVEITKYQPERVEIKVTTDQPGYLVLADSWYPGWNAFVDGQPAPIHRADVLFRAVRIEVGTHTVVFEYRPDSFFWGALVSLACLLGLGGIVLVMCRIPNKNVSKLAG